MAEPGKHLEFDQQQLDLCREFARMASVECTFAAVAPAAPAEASHVSTFVTPSLDAAIDRLRSGLAGSISVTFEWRFGSQSGNDAIKDFRLPYTTATERYARQTIQNMIASKIAWTLYDDWRVESEYRGPIHPA
ncbi:MAG: hypothetical protein ACK4S4_11475 [Pyrinomonadaceae bacterium]